MIVQLFNSFFMNFVVYQKSNLPKEKNMENNLEKNQYLDILQKKQKLNDPEKVMP